MIGSCTPRSLGSPTPDHDKFPFLASNRFAFTLFPHQTSQHLSYTQPYDKEDQHGKKNVSNPGG